MRGSHGYCSNKKEWASAQTFELNEFIDDSKQAASFEMHTSQDYLHPDINRLLQNFTKYVSKPLGFDKMYNEQVKKRGDVCINNNFITCQKKNSNQYKWF